MDETHDITPPPQPPTQRLFFALWPTDEERSALARWRDTLPDLRGRLVPAGNLHMTLAFAGNVDGETRDCLEQRAAGVRAEPCVVDMDRLGRFSRGLLWVGPGTCPGHRGDLDRLARPRHRARHRRPAARPGGRDLRARSPRARPRWRCRSSPRRRSGRHLRLHRRRARARPGLCQKLGVNLDDLLISQPDTGEQALEIADTLVRSGAVDVVVVDSVAALTPKAEIEGEMGDSLPACRRG
jgi:hypothetical protein